jgi:hypothetical protein
MQTTESTNTPRSNQSTIANVVPIVKTASCCPPVEQKTCCEQTAKASCCGAAATSGGGCGCR